MVEEKLYKMGIVSQMMRCLGEDETTLVLSEVHKGVRGSHIDGQAIAYKQLRASYYRYLDERLTSSKNVTNVKGIPTSSTRRLRFTTSSRPLGHFTNGSAEVFDRGGLLLKVDRG